MKNVAVHIYTVDLHAAQTDTRELQKGLWRRGILLLQPLGWPHERVIG
jgi:hypothetical protein